ncbi:hypothetical protein PHLCEN_2v3469 [Hermanssonia centrifuga]|uniref:Uncharacterized protein n=1 Tax=Hermanssonia centrifuga TaxID=98765 RepID=A0A2R6QIQ9_9APHY|nr:hypothetical protein PHLCEN_2v3469 [Hermanssonia centrifuga]
MSNSDYCEYYESKSVCIRQASSGVPLIAAAIQPSDPQYIDTFSGRYPDWSTELSQLNTSHFLSR